MILIREKNRLISTAAGAEPCISGRRQFLKTIFLMLLAPLVSIACERKQAGNRQGADKMHTSQNETVSKRIIPALDTQTPTGMQTATFAMG